ncbi:MAG: divalent-cation tolerance protein CutA [Halobaculum sp.]
MPTAYVTAPRDAASELAAALIEERLAACVNVVDCHSTYRWDGEITRKEPEAILLAKTTDERYPALEAYVADEHPYDLPCVERFDTADTLDVFGAWIADEVR